MVRVVEYEELFGWRIKGYFDEYLHNYNYFITNLNLYLIIYFARLLDDEFYNQ